VSVLVETHDSVSSQRMWRQRIGIGLALCGVVAVVTCVGLSLSHHSSGPARQFAKIALLPDTPPPPPPPEQPKVEPKAEIKQPVEQQKMETPPAPEQLKMEGQAGEGPSQFAAGEVKNDYIGGDIGNGRFSSYVERVAQRIQEELARRKARVANARVFLWLSPDGSVQRYELEGASGDAEVTLRAALADLAHSAEPPPQDMPMPMGLEISQR
jgi:periplasmic protein TonB